MPPRPKSKLAADTREAKRFAAALTDLVGAAAVAGDRFGVAVSGGPDSMAMLYLAHQCFGDRVVAATVDHELRRGSHDEAAMVAAWCAGRGIDHDILRPHRPITGSLQAAARQARYDLLADWQAERAVAWLLTAHHGDDQLETLMMRLGRGSGVGGLAAIRSRNGNILRPLLSWRRATLRELCVRDAVPFVDDPSNADVHFDRVRMRLLLADERLWSALDPAAIARSTDTLDQADHALDWTAQRLIAEWPDGDDPMLLRNDGYPDELLRRILVIRLTALSPAPEARGASLTHVLTAMAQHQPTMIGEWRIVPVAKSDKLWQISRAPPRKQRSTA